MLIKKQNSIEKRNAQDSTIWEYDFPNGSLGFATAKMNGRYPDKGKAKNLECDMIYYVLSGQGVIYHETGNFEVTMGDAFYFEKNKWYWVEGEDLLLVVPTAPRWSFEQYKYLKQGLD